MIVRATPEGLQHVTQADHARFAADLLRLFRLPELVTHPRRDLLLRAVGEHDNGWWEVDSAPRRNSGGTGALDFRAFPAGDRQEIWRRGVDRFAGDSPYLAALVAAHALRLSQHQREDPSWMEFRALLGGRCEELLSASGESAETLAGDDRWLALADALSLAICAGEAERLDLPGWSLALRDAEAALAPFPFAGATVFEFSARQLGAGSFASDAALGVALATSPWRRVRIRLVPL
jgi:hypothetical protein